MKKGILHVLLALFFLSVAVISGRIAVEIEDENAPASMAVSSGLDEIGGILADILWLQLDRYHHIWMYQGNDWVTATDYLPQLWLILELSPGFEQAYVDGGYHLAVNLNEYEKGIELLRRGARNCPWSEYVLWENAVVLWETGYCGSRETEEAAWQYLRLVRRKRGRIVDPWNEANANLILQLEFEQDSTRRNNIAISDHYSHRCEILRGIRGAGLSQSEASTDH